MMNVSAGRVALEKKLKELLKIGVPEAAKLDWDKQEFEISKAACLSLFSEAAYYLVTEEEFRSRARSKVIPCEACQSVLGLWPPMDFRAVVHQFFSSSEMKEEEGSEIEIIQSRNFVGVVFFTRKVTVVAVRGTAYAYDWVVNLSILKTSLPCAFPYRAPQVHAGFAREAVVLSRQLEDLFAIRSQSRSQSPGVTYPETIIITGHSLGGAVAALLHFPMGPKSMPTKCSYSFAAPRFAGAVAMAWGRTMFNLTNDADIVPRVPPTILGYDNFLYEFDMNSGTAKHQTYADSNWQFFRWIVELFRGHLLQSHAMETYRKRLCELAGLPPLQI